MLTNRAFRGGQGGEMSGFDTGSVRQRTELSDATFFVCMTTLKKTKNYDI